MSLSVASASHEPPVSAHINPEIASRILAIGTGATVVMDLWSLLLKRMGQPAANFALFGRLVGYLLRGTRPPGGPAKAPPVQGEAFIGWTLHYAIGIVFAALLVLTMGPEWARAPTFLPALLTGVATVIGPLFILQPAM